MAARAIPVSRARTSTRIWRSCVACKDSRARKHCTAAQLALAWLSRARRPTSFRSRLQGSVASRGERRRNRHRADAQTRSRSFGRRAARRGRGHAIRRRRDGHDQPVTAPRLLTAFRAGPSQIRRCAAGFLRIRPISEPEQLAYPLRLATRDGGVSDAARRAARVAADAPEPLFAISAAGTLAVGVAATTIHLLRRGRRAAEAAALPESAASVRVTSDYQALDAATSGCRSRSSMTRRAGVVRVDCQHQRSGTSAI